jgi:uncharacterized delta-60 repeat protein
MMRSRTQHPIVESLQSRLLMADTQSPGLNFIQGAGESGDTFEFGVAYSDFTMPSGIDLATIGVDDLFVTGPGFDDTNNRPTSFTTESIARNDELTVEVKYKFTRPGGFGTNVYDVFFNLGSVKDVAGNPVDIGGVVDTVGSIRIAFFDTGTPRLAVTPTLDSTSLRESLFGSNPGFNVTSFTVNGLQQSGLLSAGTFQSRGGIYGLPTGSGIALSTGSIADASSGPNDTLDETIFSGATTPQQDALLDLIVPSDYTDVTQIDVTFDAPANGASVFFNVAWGTEEEPGTTQFFDTFGLFVNGVNIAKTGSSPLNAANPNLSAVEGTTLDNVVAPGGNPLLTFEATGLQPTGNTLTLIVADGGGENGQTASSTAYISALSALTAPTPVTRVGSIPTNIDVLAIAPQGDKILAAGTSEDGQPALQRFNADGQLDTTFNGTGTAASLGLGGGAITAIKVVGDSILVTGGAGANRDVFVARYNSSGVLDTGFGGGDGVFSRDFGSMLDISYAIAVDESGRVIFAGSTDNLQQGGSDFLVGRLAVDGSDLDTGFHGTGFSIVEFDPGDVNRAGAVAVSGGTIVAAGQTGQLVGVAKFDANGELDASFDSDGRRILNELKTGDPNVGLALQGSNVLVAAADAASVQGRLVNSNFITARLTEAGNLDTTFGDRGVAKTDMGGTEDADTIVVSSDGITVLGTRTTNQAGNANVFIVNTAIARYSAEGQPDVDFGNGGFTFIDPITFSRVGNGTQAIGNSFMQFVVAAGAQVGTGLAVAKANVSGGGSSITIVGNQSADPSGVTASLTAPATITAVTSQVALTVAYSDSNGVDISDIDVNDLQVTGPAGTLVVNSAVAADASDGSPRSVTYIVTPTDGSFDSADNGTYSISLRSGEVSDINDLTGAAQSLGSLVVNIPAAPPVAIGKKKTKIDGVSYSVSNGTANVFSSGGRIDIEITGATNAALTITGPAITLGNVTVAGSLKTFNAKTATLAGVMTVSGALGKTTLAGISGTLAAGGNIAGLTLSGAATSAKILAGTILGADRATGGSDDTFAAGSIQKIAIKGAVTGTIFSAGVNPGSSGTFGDGDDTAGGSPSIIGPIAIKGAVDPSTTFLAAVFPKSAKLPLKVKPLEDVRFKVI